MIKNRKNPSPSQLPPNPSPLTPNPKWVLLLVILATTVTHATAENTIRMIFIKPGAAGSSEEASPYMAEFSAHLSTQMSEGKVVASYHNTVDTAVAELKSSPPTFAIVSLGFYLQHHKTYKMTRILRTLPKDVTQETYRILVHKDTNVGLLDLTFLGGNVVVEESFARRLILQDKVTIAFTPSVRPLSVIRKVMRKQAQAVLLDEAQYQGLVRLKYMDDLKVLFTSEVFPTPPVVRFGDVNKSQVEDFKTVLMGLKDDEIGQAVLEDLQLDGFAEPLAAEIYLKLDKKMAAPQAASEESASEE